MEIIEQVSHIIGRTHTGATMINSTKSMNTIQVRFSTSTYPVIVGRHNTNTGGMGFVFT